MNKGYKVASLVFVFVFVTSLNVFAAEVIDDNSADAIPLDGGLSLLVAAGVGYGIKKARDRKGTVRL